MAAPQSNDNLMNSNISTNPINRLRLSDEASNHLWMIQANVEIIAGGNVEEISVRTQTIQNDIESLFEEFKRMDRRYWKLQRDHMSCMVDSLRFQRESTMNSTPSERELALKEQIERLKRLVEEHGRKIQEDTEKYATDLRMAMEALKNLN